jgi:uncharacterized iron-regulated membrane protein
MRKSLLERALFQLHLWGGLILGLYAVLIGLTGSVLMFREQIVDRLAPVPHLAENAPRSSVQYIHSRIQEQYPDWNAWSLQAPQKPGEPWSSFLLQPGKGLPVFVDGEGNVLAESRLEGSWFRLVEGFHSNLLIRNGRLYNGAAGLLLALLALTGLYLWWPSRGEWSSAFRIVRTSNWKGVVYDLHRIAGALTLVFVLMFCITGAYYTWPAIYRTAVAAVLPVKPKTPLPPSSNTGERQPLDTLIAAAQMAVPDGIFLRVLVPKGSSQPVQVVLRHGRPEEHYRTSQVTVDSGTARVLALDAYADRKIGDQVVGFLPPLHTGNFGGFSVKIIWAVAGLALPLLFITGFLMWCNRVLAPRLRNRGARARPSAVPVP